MNGSEALKQFRENKGYSIRGLANEAGINFRNLTYYESGQRDISVMPINTALTLFNIYDEDIEIFIDTYYPFKSGLNAKVAVWRQNNPRITDYIVLKKRLYSQLAKLKERNRFDETELEKITKCYKNIFRILEMSVDEFGNISDELYEKYILPFSGMIEEKKAAPFPDDHIAEKIVKAICYSGYKRNDISNLIGIDSHHLRGCIKGTFDFKKMQSGNALKLCYLLGLDFKDTFVGNA